MLALDRALEEAMPYLFALLGVPDRGGPLDEMDSAVRRRRTRDAIRSVIHHESLDHTLLLIFEDLHWIDAETQSLLDLLADSIGTAHILMMLNYRPEYEHHGEARLTTLSYVSIRSGSRMPPKCFPICSAPPTELQDVKDSSSRGPKVIRSSWRKWSRLFSIRVRFVRNGAVKLARPLASIQIPRTVQGILAARIDRLRADRKGVAADPRGYRQGIFPRAGSPRHRRPDEELTQELARLQLGEFIYERPAFPESEYTFKHALTQEVAYNSVLSERRREVHERAAIAIEELFAG